MSRLRFLRLLLPAMLLALALLIWNSWRPTARVHTETGGLEAADPARASGVTFEEFPPGVDTPNVSGHAVTIEDLGNGHVRYEGIRDLRIVRDEGSDLIIAAVRGESRGIGDERKWHFEERVVFHEEDRGLELSLPILDIDESAGIAFSEGEIRFRGPHVVGRGAALTYGLRGQPGSLAQPRFDDDTGGVLEARDARLIDGVHDVELIGDVRISRGPDTFHANRSRVIRQDDGQLSSVEAWGEIAGSRTLEPGPPLEMTSQRMRARWADDGELDRVRLIGQARLTQADQHLSAGTIEIERATAAGGGWEWFASERAEASGAFGTRGRGRLSSDELRGQLEPNLTLRSAEATGHVSFAGDDTNAEAERARYDAGRDELELFGSPLRRARLGQGRTRVAGEWIRTDPSGSSLVAERQVEASILPPDQPEPASAGLFSIDKAVHFVADKLESRSAGSWMRFSGSVRGWQLERNLSADQVEIDQQRRQLIASGNVATRVPRGGTAVGSVSEADYVHATSNRLTYDDAAATAIYDGEARLRLAEGRVQSDRLEVELDPATHEIELVRALGNVRLEHTGTGPAAADPIEGRADRMEFRPALNELLLFGDGRPAEVHRPAGGGTTTGQVLRYLVDRRTIEIESGGRGPATIRTRGAE